MEGAVVSREQALEAAEPVVMNDSLFCRILKLPEEGSSEDGNTSSDFPSDLHNVDDWFKSKNDSMSGLDFDSDLKNAELDIGDLFNLKGMLQSQLSSGDCSGISQVRAEHSLCQSAFGKPESAGSSHYEKYFHLPSGAIKAGSYPLDRGIFEEMLLADSMQRLCKNKSVPHDAGDANKQASDSEEVLLPAFQELISSNTTMERKDTMRSTQTSNQPCLALDFEIHSPLTSNDQLNNLITGSFLKSKLGKDTPQPFYVDTDEGISKDQCSIKNLLSNSALGELCMDDLRCHELSVSEEIAGLPSEFFSVSTCNSIETDSRLSSILASNAHNENEGATAACKDLLDTIDKNFLKADLGINPNPDLRPSKWSYETNLSNGSLLVSNCVVDNKKDARTSSVSERLAQSEKSKEELVKNIIESASASSAVNSLAFDTVGCASSINESHTLQDDRDYADTDRPLLQHEINSLLPMPSEACKINSNSYTSKGTMIITSASSKSTQINCSTVSQNGLFNSNPALKLIQNQRNIATSSDNQTTTYKTIPMMQPSLVFSAVKSHDRKISLPQNLLLALQGYKTDSPDTEGSVPPPVPPSALRHKVVRITKAAPPATRGSLTNMTKVNLDDLRSHKGQAKVVMSVDPKVNQTSIFITSSNDEVTVFKVNSCDLVKAVSCIKDSHLDPLGLAPWQLIQRAQTASKFIKKIQQENGLLTADQLSAGTLSPSHNFEINQMLPEFKPPVSKNKNTPISSAFPYANVPGTTVGTIHVASSPTATSVRVQNVVVSKTSFVTPSTLTLPPTIESSKEPSSTRVPVSKNIQSAVGSSDTISSALQLSSSASITQSPPNSSSTARTANSFAYSLGKKLLVPKVSVSLKPGASPTMVSVPSVLDSLPPVTSFTASSCLPTRAGTGEEDRSLSPAISSSRVFTTTTTSSATKTKKVRPTRTESRQNIASSSTSSLSRRGQKRKLNDDRAATNSSKLRAVSQRPVPKCAKDKQDTLNTHKNKGVKPAEGCYKPAESSEDEACRKSQSAASPVPDAENLDLLVSRALESVGASMDKVMAAQESSTPPQWACIHPGCSTVCSKLSALKVHILNHFHDRPFRCSQAGCDWSFASSFKLKRHMETHLKRRDFVCEEPDCGRRFTTIYNLRSHLRRHDCPYQWRCGAQGCGLTFHTKRLYQMHLKTHADLQAPYKCTMEGCNKCYFKASSLTLHLRNHSRDPSELRCQWPGCDKEFDKPCRLKAHMRNHTGQRPFVCDFEGCKWSFKSSSKLTRHKRKHTNCRKFSCPVCHKSFLRSEHLKGHLLLHTGVRNFACTQPECSAKFTAKSSLYVHLKKHAKKLACVASPETGGGKGGATALYCPVQSCLKGFSSKAALKEHSLTCHSAVLGVDGGPLDYITLVGERSSLPGDLLHSPLIKPGLPASPSSSFPSPTSFHSSPSASFPSPCTSSVLSSPSVSEFLSTSISSFAPSLSNSYLSTGFISTTLPSPFPSSSVSTSTHIVPLSLSVTAFSPCTQPSPLCTLSTALSTPASTPLFTLSTATSPSNSSLRPSEQNTSQDLITDKTPLQNAAAINNINSSLNVQINRNKFPQNTIIISKNVPRVAGAGSKTFQSNARVVAVTSHITVDHRNASCRSKGGTATSSGGLVPSSGGQVPALRGLLPSSGGLVLRSEGPIPSSGGLAPSSCVPMSLSEDFPPSAEGPSSLSEESSSPAALLQGLELLGPPFDAGAGDDGLCVPHGGDLYPPDPLMCPHLLTDTSTPLHTHQTTINLRDLD
ncbi:uncharacterized protein LOC108677779 [Hyalella azteca]|uniref:Uncharacterized protein LOC108677779 n=1 Tax=Hyalella azteca TaxID=294128 RepID=A0A8B7P5X4_HYAAZ|nr:uncharacterized protein LOC108677779 [Hyalella azteca]